MRYTPKGTAVVEVGLAVNRVWTTETGEKREEVSFFNCVAFGRSAETLAQYVKKGDAIFLECRAKMEQWDDKETGKKMTTVKFIIEGFQFLPNGRQNEGGGERQERRERPARESRRAPAETKPPAGGDGGYTDQDDSDQVPF